ncbi:MAG: thioredoxin domain-containing protein [Planctomycetota bacterium]
MVTPQAPANRLVDATSPYLQQHAHNPVDWYPWGPEALARARREDRPIFLSIGYAACHWCHVMARESFESPETAAVLNGHFVNVKVDREERPDLDELYMQATMVLNQGQGGWPMSVWLTPELKPFFAGTYFPPQARWGQPGFRDICLRIAEAWRQHQADIAAHADKLAEVMRQGLRPAPADAGPLALAAVDKTAERLAAAFDAVSGGIVSGAKNKFPPAMALELLLRSATRRPADDTRRAELAHLVELTLDHIAAGGIVDQLGGGIHRYSTDIEWHVPHFEKMLYDQALVGRIYLDAWQFFRKPRYAALARHICDYVLTDLAAPEGAFYSARDADSEGVEGKYYVWTKPEIIAALGPEEGELFCAHYDVRAGGNWRDPHDPATPKNVLRELRDYRCCAKFYGISPEECERRLTTARARLLSVRAERTAPALDDKILCEWNGLMIATLARAGSVLAAQPYVAAAARATEFILQAQYHGGRLQRSYRHGRTLETAFLTDYAALVDGLLELHQATFEQRWLDAAVSLNETAADLFWDEAAGAFAFTARDHEPLIARSHDLRDGSVPSGNSLQLMNLLRLDVLVPEHGFAQRAEQLIATFAGQVQRSPFSSERFLAGVDFARAGAVEIVLAGARQDARTEALLRRVREVYLPNGVLMLREPGRPAVGVRLANADDRQAANGRPTACVCRRGACGRPVTTPHELVEELAAGS